MATITTITTPDGVTHTIGGGGSVTVDTAMSATSTNPVQNKVIYSALQGKANSSDLAEVATSGDYNDLSNTPTIPTVNDATLTIQKNGSTIDTFTANASSNKTVNVTVPTATSDLTNDSNYVSDANYVHTDNNFTSAEKTKLAGIESGAQVNTVTDVEVDGTSVVTNTVAEIDLTGKQDVLVSGTNIKTVNNQSLLGSGNIAISGGTQNTWYGECTTASATAAKAFYTVGRDFALDHGNMLRVFFPYGASALTTLNVDNTGATDVDFTLLTLPIPAYATVDFVYDEFDDSFIAETVGANVAYTLSMSSNVITLTGSDGTTSSVTLPVYSGGVL